MFTFRVKMNFCGFPVVMCMLGLIFIFQIENQRLSWNAESKIGSLEKAHHRPAGGDVKVGWVLKISHQFTCSACQI